MTDTDSVDKDRWRRRERALTAGVVTWAALISITTVTYPDQIADLIASTTPAELAAGIMISIALLGGLWDAILYVCIHWVESDDRELTTPPWEEDS